MSVAQRFFFGIMILTLFSMLMHMMPEDTTQLKMAAWSTMIQIGWIGFLLSKSKE